MKTRLIHGEGSDPFSSIIFHSKSRWGIGGFKSGTLKRFALLGWSLGFVLTLLARFLIDKGLL